MTVGVVIETSLMTARMLGQLPATVPVNLDIKIAAGRNGPKPVALPTFLI